MNADDRPLSPESPAAAESGDRATLAPTRPFLWSVRRELWENRSLYVAPLVVAALVLLGSLANLAGSAGKFRSQPSLTAAQQEAVVSKPFQVAPAPIMLTTFLVGLFYSLEALYGERRDRSLLFWKSLPVSDRTTVLAKASVPIVLLPVIAFALSVVTFGLLLLFGSAVLAANGVGAATIWNGVRFVQEPIVMLYGLTVHALWFAPIYGWLLLVSAWARRLPLLWAALPPFAIAVLEGVATGGERFGSLFRDRLTGAMARAFRGGPEALADLTPWRFLATPGLWLGLAFAAACLAGAARLRRERDPN